MNVFTFTCITPEVRRLLSFQQIPLPNQPKLGISNSPAKFAKAGFMRTSSSTEDEVFCEICGTVYGDWAGESPLAVHRVLNEKCPIMITQSATDDILQHPRVIRARRQLFRNDEPETDNTGDEDEEGDDANGDGNEGGIPVIVRDGEEEAVGNNGQETSESAQNNVDNIELDSSGSVSVPPHSEPNHSNTTQTVPPQPTFVSLMSPQAAFTFPFEPPVGGFSMLFASRRLRTFSDAGCPECIEWAEEGFIFRSDTCDVQCVFCAIILPFHTCEPKQVHVENSMNCPRVLMIDVGNITTAEEERIKLKNLQRQLKNRSSQDRHHTISYPQYEEESVRLGTYENWPHSSWDDNLQPSMMSQAGFYFTGCADKVKCYNCGIGIYRWRQGSDPWVQHAYHKPSCPHLLTKGHDFIQRAAQAQVLTEADMLSTTTASSSPESEDSPGHLLSSPPGALTLDMGAVTAALSTSRFPTKDILLGTLKAADENFTTVCQQRETIHQKDTALLQKDTALQQKDTALQQKDTALQQKDTALQQKDTALQQHAGIVEQQTQELRQKDEIIQQQQQELFLKEEELQTKEEELERRKRQTSYQESQITSLRIQMQALLAERRQAGLQAAALQAPAPPAAARGNPLDAAVGDVSIMCDIRCKVCLSAESNTIFQPCHHITCCSRCAHQLFNNCCPVCRAPIRHVLPAYIS